MVVEDPIGGSVQEQCAVICAIDCCVFLRHHKRSDKRFNREQQDADHGQHPNRISFVRSLSVPTMGACAAASKAGRESKRSVAAAMANRNFCPDSRTKQYDNDETDNPKATATKQFVRRKISCAPLIKRIHCCGARVESNCYCTHGKTLLIEHKVVHGDVHQHGQHYGLETLNRCRTPATPLRQHTQIPVSQSNGAKQIQRSRE